LNSRNPWLVFGGLLSSAAAVLHIAIIAGGPEWYRLFGAGEGMARAAARGSVTPAIITIGIASLLAISAAYAFSGAGLIRRLPLLRTGLVVISTVYLARGFALFSPALLARPDLSHTFVIWSSAIVLLFGLTYVLGTWRAWQHLSNRKTA
jgi:hypothetical protein